MQGKKPDDYLKNQKYLPNYSFYELYGYILLRIDNTQSNQPLITLQLYRLILYQLNFFVLLKIDRYFQETTLLSRLVSRQLLSLSVIFLQFSFPFYYICITACFFIIFGGIPKIILLFVFCRHFLYKDLLNRKRLHRYHKQTTINPLCSSKKRQRLSRRLLIVSRLLWVYPISPSIEDTFYYSILSLLYRRKLSRDKRLESGQYYRQKSNLMKLLSHTAKAKLKGILLSTQIPRLKIFSILISFNIAIILFDIRFMEALFS